MYRYGEHRYVVDLGRDAVFSFRRLTELTETGFIDDVSTRVVRVRMLFYNSALALLCSLSAEATLSPTGVLRTSFRTASIPVQEYMVRHSATDPTDRYVYAHRCMCAYRPTPMIIEARALGMCDLT